MRISDWSSDVCSSDLHPAAAQGEEKPERRLRQTPEKEPAGQGRDDQGDADQAGPSQDAPSLPTSLVHLLAADDLADAQSFRSEEHTSELQSLMRISYAVFCLKKKKNKTISHTISIKTTK